MKFSRDISKICVENGTFCRNMRKRATMGRQTCVHLSNIAGSILIILFGRFPNSVLF